MYIIWCIVGSPAEQVAEYCSTLESSAEWGGQLELGALAQVGHLRELRGHVCAMKVNVQTCVWSRGVKDTGVYVLAWTPRAYLAHQ